MDVRGLGSLFGAIPLKPSAPAATPVQGAETKPISTHDQVEISPVGRMFDAADQGSPVRAERLQQIKAAIDQGVYDTDEKLHAALERLLAELGTDEDDGRTR